MFEPFHERAIRAVSAASGVPGHVIRGRGQNHTQCRARWAVMHAMRCRDYRGKPTTLNMIGRQLGGRNHTTVLYGLGQASWLLVGGDAEFKALFEIASNA